MANTSQTIVIDAVDSLQLGGHTTKRSVLERLQNYLGGLKMGSKRGIAFQLLNNDVVSKPAVAHIALASCAAGTVLDINGALLTAISGTPTVANNEFDISGADAADAVSLAAAINASTSAELYKVVKAVNPLKDVLTPSTAIAGDKFAITLADGSVHTFYGVAGAATLGDKTFSIDTSNAATAASIVAQVAGYGPFADKLTAIDGTTIVTFRSLDGNTFTLLGTASTLAESGGATVTLSAYQRGALGNALDVYTRGIAASAVITVASITANDTVTLNGQVFTSKQQRGTGTLTCSTAIAGNTFSVYGYVFTGQASAVTVGELTFDTRTSDTACAASIVAQINGFAGLSGIVTATNVSGVVTVRAVTAGTAGNSIALTGTVTTLAASAATLTGGIAVANNEFEAIGTDTQIAADLVRAVGASTTALVNRHIRATSAAAVVTVWSRFAGLPGNTITVATSNGSRLAITGSATRLTGGTTATAEGAQATGTITLSSGSGTITAIINGVSLAITWTSTDTASATLLAAKINDSADPLILGIVDATSSAGVVTINATRGGFSGNAITLSATGTGATASVSRLASGALPSTVLITNTSTLSRTNGAIRASNGTGGAVTAINFAL